jgi:hypothetical protein
MQMIEIAIEKRKELIKHLKWWNIQSMKQQE